MQEKLQMEYHQNFKKMDGNSGTCFNMSGRIIKGIAGFYYVICEDHQIYECKAKGLFRKKNEKPLVGDFVRIAILDNEKKLGNIVELYPRNNSLIRPSVANIDQAMVIFSVDKPKPNLNLLDRFLLMIEQNRLPCIIVFNKCDLVSREEMEEIRSIYQGTGHDIYFTSAKKEIGILKVKEVLNGKTTTVAGPSGVGKSSFINLLQNTIQMETGAISNKIERGKHTTRHSELIALNEDSYIFDTPGFSSLAIFDLEKEELKDYYPEFLAFRNQCKYLGCNHINEPNCMVKEAVEDGRISKIRYDNYKLLFEECNNRKKY